MRKIIFTLFVCLSTISAMWAQGVTTSSIAGQITDANGDPLVGANVTARHEPSGTFYGNTTDLDGYYRISNMRIGGPYTITITYTGFAEFQQTGIFLQVGKPLKVDKVLVEEGVQLDEVVISAKGGTVGMNSGTSTQISNEQINTLPTVSRSVSDFTRLTPQASSTPGGGTSFSGINNRYNGFYIDGAVNNDVFGLNDSGTNGEGAGIQPFSLDIIDQVQVVLSPYDVSFGGFAGGGINAVTRSGTNDFYASAYYYWQNEGLAGSTNQELVDRGADDDKLADFSEKTYGFTVGGPIKKDKIFFFTNVEIEDKQTPRPFDISQYRGASSVQDLNNLASFLQSEYDYDPGGFQDQVTTVDGLKIFGKLDFNLNNNNKLTLRHQYTKGEQTSPAGSSSSRVSFGNSGVFYPSTTNTSALELNTQIGNDASNNLIIGFTSVRDDRDPIGQNFPHIDINDGDGSISLGSEEFSTGNQLNQDVLTLTNNFKLYRGKHTWTFGTHNEYFNIYNLFIRQNYGTYDYNSVDEFLNGERAFQYDRSFSLVDNVTGDGSAAAAEFSALQLGFYAQDQIDLSPRFQLTAGLRLDIPFILDDPAQAPDWNTTSGLITGAGYDLQGAVAGQAPSAQLMFSPRLGFNYDASGDGSTVVRGGLGIFTSRIPFVWPGAMFSNNGATVGGFRLRGDDVPEFNPNFDQQIGGADDVETPNGQMDLFAEDFKYPQIFRTSLGVDKYFGNGFSATLEGMFTKNLNNVFYQNVNSDPEVAFNWTNGEGNADDRPVYVEENLDDRYVGIYLASNTSEGYTYNVTATINKRFDFGLNAMLAYSYGDAEAIFEGTSSQNSSQWRGAMNVDGRNNAILGRSDFSPGSRIVGSLSYTQNWAGSDNFATTISLFYNGQSGRPYSYVYGRGAADGRNVNNEVGSTSRTRSLIYVPASAADIELIDTDDMTAAEQWNALNTYIEEDEYLSENRGEYVSKNTNRTPFTHQFDLRIMQNIGTTVGDNGHKLQLTLDMLNFGNFINSSWGVVYDNPFAYELLNFEGYAADGTTPQFTLNNNGTFLGDERFDIADRASRYRIQLGIRYIFD